MATIIVSANRKNESIEIKGGETLVLMGAFFKAKKFTEFLAENNEIWVFPTTAGRVKEDTLRVCIRRDNGEYIKKGTKRVELPITDECGAVRYVKGWAYTGFVGELEGTEIERKVAQFLTR